MNADALSHTRQGLFAALAFTALFFIAATPLFADALININTADAVALETLNGIGPSKAQAVIDYRTQNGPFATIEDIQNVSGIGPATYNNIKDYITVSGGVSSTSQDQASTSSTDTSSSQTSSGQGSSGTSQLVSSYVPPPVPELFADAGNDRTVIVGADVEFKGRAYNRGQEIVDNVRFSWNFGDGATAEGSAVLHHFAYPGRYAVVLTIAEERETVSDRIIVTAEAAAISLSALSDGGVAIENRGTSDLDLSRWIIYSSGSQFFLPENSLVLAGQTIRIAENTLGFFAGAGIELLYPNGAFALRAGESVTRPDPVPSPSAGTQASPQESEASDVVAARMPANEVEGASEDNASGVVATSSQVAAAAASGSWSWWIGALALAGVGAGAIYFARHYAKREWDIIDDTAE